VAHRRRTTTWKRAPVSAAHVGRIIADGYAYFAGTDAYVAHVRLPDGSERVMLFVDYGGRSCTVIAEMSKRDETAMEFLESFRPEPAAR
jgi:hypothetical protein